jgi:hypothetical protein
MKVKPSSRYGKYFDSSPYTNYSKVKRILGLSDSKYSALSSYRHLKLPSDKTLKKPFRDVSLLFPMKKYSILPKLKHFSDDRENSELGIREPINLDQFMGNQMDFKGNRMEFNENQMDFKENQKMSSHRKIVISKHFHQNCERGRSMIEDYF